LDETGVDIELDQSGTLYVGFDESDEAELDRRFRWQNDAGLTVKRLDRSAVKSIEHEVSDSATGGLFFPDEGQVENRKLVEALDTFARSNGIDIREGVEARRVVVENARVTGVDSSAGVIAASQVVVATGAWASHIELGDSRLPVDVKPVRGQMICYRPDEVNIRHVVYSRRGYLVPRADGRLLAGATVEDVGFDVSTTDTAMRMLKDIAKEITPRLAEFDVTDHWAGLRPFADGGLPFIGKVDDVEGLFAAVGHFRNGILLTPITAKLIADQVLGNDAVYHAVKR
jgi:glycine oxidase